MNKELRDNLLKNLGENDKYGPALEDWLSEEIEKMKDVSSVESWEETLGRQEALKLIDKLRKFLFRKPPKKKQRIKYQ